MFAPPSNRPIKIIEEVKNLTRVLPVKLFPGFGGLEILGRNIQILKVSTPKLGNGEGGLVGKKHKVIAFLTVRLRVNEMPAVFAGQWSIRIAC